MDKIIFLGKEYDVHYNMLSFEKIAEDMGVENIEEMGQQMMSGNIKVLLKSSRIIAFNGLLCASKVNGTDCPFDSVEQLGEKVTKFSDLNPFSEVFTKTWLGFFTDNSNEKVEKKAKGSK